MTDSLQLYKYKMKPLWSGESVGLVGLGLDLCCKKIFTNDSLQVQKLHLFGVEDLLARLVGPCVAALLRVVLQASHQG